MRDAGDEVADAAADEGDTEGDARKISTQEAKSYAEEEGLLFFETSAKTGMNVQEVFTAIANAIPETQLKGLAARGGGGGAQTALGGAGGRGADESARVNLTSAGGVGGAKEGCAC